MDRCLSAATGLSTDTRTLQPGDAFLAYVTDSCDRRQWVDNAIEKGASAIVYEVDSEQDPIPTFSVPVCPVVQLYTKLGSIADAFYGNPSRDMTIIGITGTNGKTSIAYYLLQALTQLDIPTAMIGTLGYGDLSHMHTSNNTTPGVVDVHRLLAQFRDQGKKVVVMEVSSHALDQGRVDHVLIDIGVFTNLTQDHLDYHGDMDTYAAVKERLFSHPGMTKAVCNVDDAWGAVFYDRYQHSLDIRPISLQDSCQWHHSLVGDFNRMNVLCVAAVLEHMGFASTSIDAVMPQIKAAPGRMQMITAPGFAKAVVDYAHTPDALEKALQAVRPMCDGQLWCVVGCGGDRDTDKRPLMARIAEQYADTVILTDDNPRHENPVSIVKAMLSGVDQPEHIRVEHVRVRAIHYAMQHATDNDVVLVAGKGHETYQIIGNKIMHSDDVEIIQDIMQAPISIDTRTLQAGDVYIAIRGEHADGHDFLEEAMNKGASCALVETEYPNVPLKQIVVEDTVKALGAYAKQHRLAMAQITLIALTGSCGKTTTRQFLQSICEQVASTHASIKSFNNHLGVPLTLLGIRPEHDIVVQEMGANHHGELSYLTSLAKPDVAMITNVGPVHLDGFGSVEGVSRAKAEIFEGLGPDGIAVLNADDAFYEDWKQQLRDKRVVSFGQQHSADVMAQDIQLTDSGCAHFNLHIQQAVYPVTLKMLGMHNVMNALSAAACAHAIGIAPDAIVAGLQSAAAVERRMRVVPAWNGSRMIDDSYNANPVAVMAAIDALMQFEGTHILVLGDMAELGSDAVAYHEKMGRYARDQKVDQLYCVGHLTQHAVNAFGDGAQFFESKEALVEHLKNTVDASTTLLVKGSLSMAMDDITRSVCA